MANEFFSNQLDRKFDRMKRQVAATLDRIGKKTHSAKNGGGQHHAHNATNRGAGR